MQDSVDAETGEGGAAPERPHGMPPLDYLARFGWHRILEEGSA